MAGHVFKIVHVHQSTGEIDVEWDGDPNKVITCRVTLGGDEKMLPDAEFKADIVRQCADRLEHWDRVTAARLDAIHNRMGRTFDVTEEFALRKIAEPDPQPAGTPLDEFKLEDHV